MAAGCVSGTAYNKAWPDLKAEDARPIGISGRHCRSKQHPRNRERLGKPIAYRGFAAGEKFHRLV
jgi:hypothetical protein